MKKGFYRLPFSMTFFGHNSLHLMSRHSHQMWTKGYWAPLAMSCWVFFMLAPGIVLIISAYYSYPTSKEYFKLIINLLIFTFYIFYTQDLRSSTIEAWYESMPEKLNDVNLRSQHVIFIGNIPYVKYMEMWNRQVLNSYGLYNPNSICQDYTCKIILYALRRMAKDPNYFMVISEDFYYGDILKIHSYDFRDQNFNGEWEWKLSPKVSGYFMEGAIHQKYQKWSESLNLFVAKLLVTMYNFIIVLTVFITHN